ncbi:protealysin inhibitor emfourin [uncultured Amaricoccus sp.]|uniref:protealysin inhibitor emfourin n=1 Tax=uncultured Amaricoccus sp. TaxID=339341 RepID=UPI00260B245A|nr:protealysin inhibitor emfourin [uncultured Amaricoccus sp.]
MMVTITITTSGGIGGFGLAKKAEVAVESLPEPLRVEACEKLDPGALEALAARRPRGGPDRVVYHIVVVETGGTASFDLPETALPAGTLDLIDELLARGR